MPIDDVAARGFGAGAAAYEPARPGYPDAAVDAARRRGSASARDRGLRPGRRHRQAHPAPRSSSAPRSWPSSRWRPCAAQLRRPCPASRCRRRHRRGHPARRRVGRRRHRRPGVPLVRRPAALAEIARVPAPGGGLAILWNERDESHRLGGGDEPDHPLARAHGVALPAHSTGPRSSRRRGRFTPLVEERGLVGPADRPRELLADRCGRSATSPSCRRPSASASPSEVVRAGRRAASEPFPLPYVCRVQWCQRRLTRAAVALSSAGGTGSAATCRGARPATRGRCSCAS